MAFAEKQPNNALNLPRPVWVSRQMGLSRIKFYLLSEFLLAISGFYFLSAVVAIEVVAPIYIAGDNSPAQKIAVLNLVLDTLGVFYGGGE